MIRGGKSKRASAGFGLTLPGSRSSEEGTSSVDLMGRDKVIVRKLDGQIIKGYLETASDVTHAEDISISSLTENVIEVPKRK